ncbi:MAG: SufD family Fe-S cluster assembly protein [Rikenellaceae bacterium]
MKNSRSLHIEREQNHFEVLCGGELKIRVDRDATCEVIVLGEASVEVELVGQGAECKVYGLVVAAGSEDVKINSTVRHIAENCKSHQIFRAVATDNAVVHFGGMIYVEKGAEGSVALQQSDNIVLSDGAKVLTDPQMEIYAEDVQCNHGATVGRRDELALFYMRQRGMCEKDAMALLLESFCYAIVEVGHQSSEIDEYIKRGIEKL